MSGKSKGRSKSKKWHKLMQLLVSNQ
jgi:hypothetical protein